MFVPPAPYTVTDDITLCNRRPTGDLKWFMNTTSGFVTTLAEDEYYRGNLLFSDYCALGTTLNGVDISYVAGEPHNSGYREGRGGVAMFRTISSFVQQNSTHVLVTDRYNHCVRVVNRQTNQTSPFAGRCQISGGQDGNLTEATFITPWGIAAGGQYVFVADLGGWTQYRTWGAVRKIDLSTGLVVTLHQNDTNMRYPMGLVLDEAMNYLLITSIDGIFRLNLTDQASSAPRLLTSGQEGFKDGPIADTRFRYPEAIVSLGSGVYAIADYMGQRVRLFDYDSDNVSSICMGKRGLEYKNAESCKLFEPSSVGLIGSTLYIGMKHTVATIQLELDSSSAPGQSTVMFVGFSSVFHLSVIH